MTPMKRLPTCRPRGAALLAALLTVALVATLAAAGLWQQWRAIEVETAERARMQAGWVLTGALGWGRMILREDARSGVVDHLAEPWAVPLQEARLSAFLAANRDTTTEGTDVDNAFLSGEITDLQSRLNVMNLLDGNRLSDSGLRSFQRLFEQLGLPPAQLTLLAENLPLAAAPNTPDSAGRPVPLMPLRTSDLGWLGLPSATVATLQPYVAVLPSRVPVNLNTANAQVIYAAIPGSTLAEAQQLVAARGRSHFRTIADATRLLGENASPAEALVSVGSSFFEIHGRLRLGDTVVEERTVVHREGLSVRPLQRERGALLTSTADGQEGRR